MEVSGDIYVVRGKHLISFHFATMAEWHELMHWIDEKKFEPYFAAKATQNADVVINGLATALNNPAVQLQSTEPPYCPVHKQRMKASDRGGWYCTKKVLGEYCSVEISPDGTIKGLNGKRA